MNKQIGSLALLAMFAAAPLTASADEALAKSKACLACPPITPEAILDQLPPEGRERIGEVIEFIADTGLVDAVRWALCTHAWRRARGLRVLRGRWLLAARGPAVS